MICAKCGEEIVTNRLIAWDPEKQIVVRVYGYTAFPPREELQKIEKEPNTVLLLGEPHVVDGANAYHLRCLRR